MVFSEKIRCQERADGIWAQKICGIASSQHLPFAQPKPAPHLRFSRSRHCIGPGNRVQDCHAERACAAAQRGRHSKNGESEADGFVSSRPLPAPTPGQCPGIESARGLRRLSDDSSTRGSYPARCQVHPDKELLLRVDLTAEQNILDNVIYTQKIAVVNSCMTVDLI